MSTIESIAIVSAVEAVRREIHPNLDRQFLEAVVRAEEQYPEDDAAAIGAIESALRRSVGRDA